MNLAERDVRRLLRQLGSSAGAKFPAHWLRQALRGCTARRRATLACVLGGRGRGRFSDRSYYRAKKEAVERLAAVMCDGSDEDTGSLPKSLRERTPIALGMVDRLVPDRIGPERYRGPDRGRALSAAALSAEMSGDPERADALIAQAADNVFNQFGRRDVASVFEVSQNEFFIARCRSNLRSMGVAVAKMVRLHDRLGAAERLKVALDCSEVHLYEGRLRDAELELNYALRNGSPSDGTLLRSIACVRKSQIALASHDLRRAEEFGKAATEIARRHADVRVYAAEVLGRSALQTGSRWSSDGLEECRSAYHALCVGTVLARHRLARGRHDGAYETAENSYHAALRLGYWNLAGRSAATLAACLAIGDARSWLAQALRLYLIPDRQNAYIGDDLFDLGPRGASAARAFLQSERAAALVSEAYFRRTPRSVFESGEDSLPARLAMLLLRGALDSHVVVPPNLFKRAPDEWSRRPAGLPEVEREIRKLAMMIATLCIAVPFAQREEFIAACRRQTHRALHALRRSLARRHWGRLNGFSNA